MPEQPAIVLSPPWHRMLIISTSHLPERLGNIRNGKLLAASGVSAYELASDDDVFGALAWVPDDPDSRAADYEEPDHPDENVPAELLAVQRFAREHGADWIMFDRDASPISDLPTWDW